VSGRVKPAAILFGIQLVLNLAWSPVFFGARSAGGALVVIIVLWAAILATVVAFARVRPLAAWLLAPYLAWVSYATALNAAIVALN
jgi:tryptophan-rich sensory protein